jgi:hypothetical protein
MLYHRTACESSEDSLVEVIDYCYRKFVNLNNNASHYYELQEKGTPERDPKAYLDTTKEGELSRNATDIEFQCSMICFSLIRFISDHLRDLSVPIVH